MKIENIIESEENLNTERSLIWIWNASGIPPHVGISTKGKYFSLKALGRDEMLDVINTLLLAKRKRTPTLIFELVDEIEVQELELQMNKFEKTIPFQITCLAPINEILKQNCSKLDELLTNLYRQSRIRRVFGFKLIPGFTGIKNYSVDDIHLELEKLANDSV